ncbi:hypothetical protein [Moritella viscosa]|uniref:hypothetical protein n=1 Tax=Moritella viscosa TaxID=80854 RepID=UPI0009163649|nr:hypothetical protein [Moritella viscosa]SGZ09459.1 Putative uncharacterized protein [Moritella viscosa]
MQEGSEGKTMRARCEAELVSRIENYREKESLKSDSAAIRKLLIFALDILDSSADAPAVSNREIFEELLYLAKSSSSLVSQAHSYTFRNDLTDEGKVEAKVARVAARNHGKKETEVFLAGK